MNRAVLVVVGVLTAALMLAAALLAPSRVAVPAFPAEPPAAYEQPAPPPPVEPYPGAWCGDRCRNGKVLDRPEPAGPRLTDDPGVELDAP